MSTLERRIEQLELRVAALEKQVSLERTWDDELDLLREELLRPVDRTPEDIDRALAIAGIGEGPSDLSRNF